MKKSTLYKLLGYAALIVIMLFAGDLMESTGSRARLLAYLAGGSLMYWGVMVWLYGMKHRNDPQNDETEDERKALPGNGAGHRRD